MILSRAKRRLLSSLVDFKRIQEALRRLLPISMLTSSSTRNTSRNRRIPCTKAGLLAVAQVLNRSGDQILASMAVGRNWMKLVELVNTESIQVGPPIAVRGRPAKKYCAPDKCYQDSPPPEFLGRDNGRLGMSLGHVRQRRYMNANRRLVECHLSQ